MKVHLNINHKLNALRTISYSPVIQSNIQRPRLLSKKNGRNQPTLI